MVPPHPGVVGYRGPESRELPFRPLLSFDVRDLFAVGSHGGAQVQGSRKADWTRSQSGAWAPSGFGFGLRTTTRFSNASLRYFLAVFRPTPGPTGRADLDERGIVGSVQ